MVNGVLLPPSPTPTQFNAASLHPCYVAIARHALYVFSVISNMTDAKFMVSHSAINLTNVFVTDTIGCGVSVVMRKLVGPHLDMAHYFLAS